MSITCERNPLFYKVIYASFIGIVLGENAM